ncbi:MAG: hypothetical protein C4547_04520 [Phycisphaerales bacterium]|nr:MAG: hypothetical protein C4547_04520 [Phycisphaerales bacterium]
MRQILTIGFALWALVVVPSLCRAGLLTACCHDGDSPGTAAAAGSNGCCGSTARGQSPDEDGAPARPAEAPCPWQPPSEQRECDTCVIVCGAVAKPAESSGAAEHAVVQHCPLAFTSVAVGTAAPCSCIEPTVPPESGGLPFPISDRPLRV